jgi:hypothetical protein
MLMVKVLKSFDASRHHLRAGATLSASEFEESELELLFSLEIVDILFAPNSRDVEVAPQPCDSAA